MGFTFDFLSVNIFPRHDYGHITVTSSSELAHFVGVSKKVLQAQISHGQHGLTGSQSSHKYGWGVRDWVEEYFLSQELGIFEIEGRVTTF